MAKLVGRHEFPIRFEFQNQLRVVKVVLTLRTDGESEVLFYEPEMAIPSGSWDRGAGGCLGLYNISLEDDDGEYEELEKIIFDKVYQELPFFFNDNIIYIMKSFAQ